MKKVMVLLMSALMVFGLAACGSRDSGGSSSDSRPSGGNVTLESTPEPGNQSGGEPSSQPSGAGTETGVSEENASGALTENQDAEPESGEGKTLVVYYSATGHTENVANYIAAATGADLFELEPVEEYSSADLDWTDKNSRVSQEYAEPDKRTVELVSTTVEDWESYDTVFIGYPIWWHIAAWPVNGFVEANDFTGKTVIPFCTSSSSDLGESGELLEELAETGEWLEGERFRSSASETDVQTWVESLGGTQ